jgi:hypothetical protein
MEDYVTKTEFQNAVGRLEIGHDELRSAVKRLEDGQQEILDTVNHFASYVQENMATKQDLADMKLELIDTMDRKDERLRGDLTVLIRKQSFGH